LGAEIERKFLVPDPPGDLERCRSVPIEQGYIAANDDSEVRIRSLADRTFLTVKRGSGLERAEREVEITRDQFGELWGVVEEDRITKRRFYVPLGDVTAEVDVYGAELEGLVTAEVEFESVEQSGGFEPPEWFGTEVTGDSRFANKALARAKAPPEATG
jgi:CYTH domain-containing protein